MPTDKQRRAAERRRRERQLGRRYERYQRRRRWMIAGTGAGIVAILVLVIAFVVATNHEDQPAAKKTTSAASVSPSGSTAASTAVSSSASSAAALARYPCTFAVEGTAAKKGIKAPTDTRPARTGTVTVSVTTTRGPMTFTLNRALAPCAVESFVSLVGQGYYNSTPCHRLVTSGIYVLQCGDPTGTGSGGPGYTVNDEGTGTETYPAGTIAMARTEAANSTGSQFFIVYKDSPNLKQGLGLQQYTEFGTVSAGLGVVTKVAAAGAATGTDGKPKLPITITRMTASGTGK